MPCITIGPDFPLDARYGDWHLYTLGHGRWELYRLRYSLYGGGTCWVHGG